MSSNLTRGTKMLTRKIACGIIEICECGGMVYTADLKSAAEMHAGSSPATRTNTALV